MTYLQLVNQVLRRLREDEVASVNDTDYSKLAGDLVNDAYTMVVNAWDWSSLRSDVLVTTSDGNSEYALTDADRNSEILFALNRDSKTAMQYYPLSTIERYYNNTPATGNPYLYTISRMNSGDPVVKLYPEPDGVYEIVFTVTARDPLLEGDDDVLLVPHSPVIHLAVAYMARERGEAGGTTTAEYFAMAEKYLSDAVAYDANRSPEKITWNYI